MAKRFAEDDIHGHLYRIGLNRLVHDVPALGERQSAGKRAVVRGEPDKFELWRVIKARVLDKLSRLHSSVRGGQFIGSKVKLPIDNTRPMELDLLGQHEGGLFILELKVDRTAERNSFSELFAYSNYLAQMFRHVRS